MITPIIVQLQRIDGTKVNYLKKKDNNDVSKMLHKCRLKEVIYGGVFAYYADGMNFQHALDARSKITIDERHC